MRTGSISVPDYQQVLALYREQRFLDAYRLTESWWKAPQRVEELDPSALILAGRLAARLGSGKYQRALFRLAQKKAPDDPEILYYVGSKNHRWESLYQELRRHEARPELGSTDPDLEASWFAQHAVLLSMVRDFDRAQYWIKRARDVQAKDAWVLTCAATVFLAEHRREEALEAAQKAWSLAPGMPSAAHALGHALGAQGKLEEASQRLTEWVQGGGQSHEVSRLSLHYTLACIERRSDLKNDARAASAYRQACALPELAPLADRHARRVFAAYAAEFSGLIGDRHAMRAHAAQVKTPFYRTVVKNLEKNPPGNRTLLPHDPIRQKHNSCLPASAIACLHSQGAKPDHDALVQEMTYDGTPYWRLIKWAEGEGLVARAFIGTKDSIVKLLAAGYPFVFTQHAMANAHALAAVGFDLAKGTLLFHDPSGERLGELLLDGFARTEAPFGPECLVLANKNDSAFLNLPLPDEIPASASFQYDRIRVEENLRAAVTLAEENMARHPEHPVAKFLLARARLDEGRARDAMTLMQSLLSLHPQSVVCQRALLVATSTAGDATAYRELLRAIVEETPLPGIDGSTEWIHPLPVLIARYADVLAQSTAHGPEAHKKLEMALRRNASLGEAYHYLGDLLLQEDRDLEAILPHRISSCLDTENEHYAEAYAWTLRKCGRLREGIDWLQRRTQKLTQDVGAGAAWITLVQSLEDFGEPAMSLAELEKGLSSRPDDHELIGFAVVHLSRFGRFDEAKRWLAKIQKGTAPLEEAKARCVFFRMTGDLKAALAAARSWVEEAPRHTSARAEVLKLVRATQGGKDALDLLDSWMQERPDREDLELLLLEQLGVDDQHERRREILRARVKRNPLDAWAFRELGWALERDARASDESRRNEAIRELAEVVEACRQVSDRHPSAMALEGELYLLRGDTEEAFSRFRAALIASPDYDFAIDRLFQATAKWDAKDKRRAIEAVDQAFAHSSRDLSAASTAAFAIANTFGLDEAKAALKRWMRRSKADPWVAEAWADLHLDLDPGQPSLRRILPRLRRMVERYPLHGNLSLSLARAYQLLHRYEDAKNTYQSILRFQPENTTARLALSKCWVALDQPDNARQTLEEAVQRDPSNHRSWLAYAARLNTEDQGAKAAEVLATAIEKLPQVMDLWEQRIQVLESIGELESAIETARTLARRYPDGAYAALVLARTLRDSPLIVQAKEIEAAFERSLSLNAELWEAVEEYRIYLVANQRFEEAATVIQTYAERAEDPTQARGSLAEVKRASGQTQEALMELSELLTQRPDYLFGWNLFFDWVQTDRKWELAKKMLPRVTPELRENISFECSRLELLIQAGAPLADVDTAFHELAEKYPRSREVLYRRFDVLLENGDPQKARAEIETWRKQAPNDPFGRTRHARALTVTEGWSCALSVFEPVWGDEDASPADVFATLELMEGKAAFRAVSKQVLDRLSSGHPVAVDPLQGLLRLAFERKDKRLLKRLLRALGSHLSRDGFYQVAAQILETLNELRASRVVIRWMKRHRKACEKNIELWQAVVGAYGVLDRDRSLIHWMRGWENREGIELWAMSNYVAALYDTRRYAKAIEVGRRCLTTIAYDSTAGHIAENILRAAILRKNYPLYSDLYETFGRLLFMREERTEISKILDFVHKVVTTTDPDQLVTLHRESSVLRVSVGWPRQLWYPPLYARLPFLRRVALWLGLYDK